MFLLPAACALGGDGTLHVIYATTSGIRYLTDAPGASVETVRTGASIRSTPSIAVRQGTPSVSYLGDDRLAVAHRRAGAWVIDTVATHRFGPQARRFGAIESDRLIAAHRGGAIDRARLRGIGLNVFAIAHDKEGAGLCDASQPAKIDVAAVNHQITARLDGHLIQPQHVRVTSLGNGREYRQGRAQIEHRVELDRRIGAGPVGPRTQGKTQVDESGVECIHRRFQIEYVGLITICLACPVDQLLRDRGEQLPRPLFVHSRERAARHARAESEVIPQAGLGIQTRLDITQALAKGDLREAHRKEVIPRGKRSRALRLVVLDRRASKLPMWHTRHYLRENRLAFIHAGNARKKADSTQIVSKAKSAEQASDAHITESQSSLSGTALGCPHPAPWRHLNP